MKRKITEGDEQLKMKFEKRVFIDEHMVNEAIQNHTEKQLLCYATELLNQGRLVNEEIIDRLMKVAAPDDELSLQENSGEDIYKNVIATVNNDNAYNHVKNMRMGKLTRIAAIIMASIVLIGTGTTVVTYANKARKMEAKVVEKENGSKSIVTKGDYAVGHVPYNLHEVWVPDGYYLSSKQYNEDRQSSEGHIYFRYKNDPDRYILIHEMMEKVEIEIDWFVNFEYGEPVYKYDGVDHYMGFSSACKFRRVADWLDGQVRFIVSSDNGVSREEMEHIIRDIHKIKDSNDEKNK